MNFKDNSVRITLLSEIFPPIHGGSGRWFAEMYPRLTNADVTYIVGNHPDAKTLDIEKGWKTHRWDFGWHFNGIEDVSQMGKHLKGAWRLRRFLQRHPTDQLHAGRPLSEGFVAAMACPKHTPLVCFVHGEDVSVAKTSRQLTLVTRWTLSRCSRLIANSKNTQSMLQNEWNIPEDKILLIHPGVNCGQYTTAVDRDSLRESLGWEGRLVVLTVGRLQRRKGQDTALHCVVKLRERFPNLLWVIAGSGQDAEYLRELAQRLDVQANVRFHDSLNDRQLQEMYRAADIFVLPNRTVGRDIEGFGIVLLEAQASGLPVIAGDSGGTIDAVSDGVTGHVVDCSDIENPRDLAEKLTRLLESETQRIRFGQAGVQWATSFDWERVANRAWQEFETLDRQTQRKRS
ncbi:glycosyltransferase family 4 protein [Stieleria varia]|nr:glycosyltransferase family 4 protein [Stieleria varia]